MAPIRNRHVSDVWRYFTIDIVNPSQAICTLCKKSLKRGGSTSKDFGTGNLKQHLKAKHPGTIDTAFSGSSDRITASVVGAAADTGVPSSSSSCSASTASTIPSQPTLESCLARKQPFHFNHPKAMEITRAIMELIALDLQPFSIVNDFGFRRLLELLEPRYSIPSDKYFRETALQALNEKVTAKAQTLMASVKWCSFTTDMWTSAAMQGYLCITAHFICEDFTRKELILKCTSVNQSHTADRILAVFEASLQEWGPGLEHRVHLVIRDGGRNMVAAFRDSFLNMTCIIHTLQLVVKSGCLDSREIREMLHCARQLVGSFKHSVVHTQALTERQIELDLPVHRLQQDVPTRWDSAYIMLQRLLEQTKAITQVCRNENNDVNLSKRQWMLAEKVTSVLEVFYEATLMASDSNNSVSVIIPIINCLRQTLQATENDHGIVNMKRQMLNLLDQHYGRVEFVPHCALATLLDPRYKAAAFKSEAACQTAKDSLTEALRLELLKRQDTATDPEISAQSPREKNPKPNPKLLKIASLLGNLLESGSSSASSVQPPPPSSADIISTYLNETKLGTEEDPLLYWKQYKSKSSHCAELVNLAVKYLSAPPSSVASERAFSTSGNICDDKRTRLNPDKLEMLVFVAKNYKTLCL